MRSRTIEMARNKASLRKALVVGLEQFGVKETKFVQGNLHLLKPVVFERHMTGFAALAFSLNNYYYPTLVEEIDKILLLIDAEIKENKG